MIIFYLLPIDKQTINGQVMRGPKYFTWRFNLDGISCRWSMKDYGSIDMAVLAADISQGDHDALILNSDVYAFPIDLDVTMQLVDRQAFNTYAESHGIPADWVTPTTTFRGCLKITTGMMLYIQKVTAIMGYPEDPTYGITLNTQYKNITNPLHDALRQASDMFGYTWSISDNDQVRKIFKVMSDQWGDAPIHFGFIAL